MRNKLIGMLSCVVAGTVNAAPITFKYTDVLGQGAYLIHEQFEIEKFKDDKSPQDRWQTRRQVNTTIGFGFHSRFDVFLTLPIKFNDHHFLNGATRIKQDTTGFGDLELVARFRTSTSNKIGDLFHVSPLLGVKFPTAPHTETDANGILPNSIQRGTGTYEYIVGINASSKNECNLFDLQALYKLKAKHDDDRRGDEIFINFSYANHVYPRNCATKLKGKFYGVIDASFRKQQKDKIRDAPQPNTGGMFYYLTPGFQYTTNNWSFDFGVSIPVSQNVNGDELKNSFIYKSNFRVKI